MGIKEEYYHLLKTWCDSLINLQIREFHQKEFFGGMLCPACKIIHGRVGDAIYPMVFLYDRTGDKKYLDSAKSLFCWSENMLADDGSYYNDGQNDWNGITVFFVSMMARTLIHHGDCLPKEIRKQWEDRLQINAEWIYRTIDGSFEANINYQAAAAEALALCGIYMKNSRYLAYSKARAEFAMKYFSESGFLVGESHPRDYLSPRGVPGVDMGYNLEESLPALFECAKILGEKEMEIRLLNSLRVHARFLLPDGGMDNSFGTRNYKWTYWGSRTSDGYLAMMEQAGREREEFLSCKYAAFHMLSKCTKGGLLYGGPDYFEHEEQPCIHHTFCKAKAVAALLDEGILERDVPVGLPKETKIYSYPELLTEQYFCRGFYASATAGDAFYQKGGHISGGTIGMLWHEKTGPLLAASMMEYGLYEVTNSQLSRKKADLGKMSLRFERKNGKKFFSSDQDYNANLTSREHERKIYIGAAGTLTALDGEKGEPFQFSYQISKGRFEARCRCEGKGSLFAPVIGKKIEKIEENQICLTSGTGWPVKITWTGRLAGIKKRFHLCGGFLAWEIEIWPDKGESKIVLEAE